MSTSAAPVDDVLKLACRAPSVHNTQPWRWRVRENRVDLYADLRRQRSTPTRNGVTWCSAAARRCTTSRSPPRRWAGGRGPPRARPDRRAPRGQHRARPRTAGPRRRRPPRRDPRPPHRPPTAHLLAGAPRTTERALHGRQPMGRTAAAGLRRDRQDTPRAAHPTRRHPAAPQPRLPQRARQRHRLLGQRRRPRRPHPPRGRRDVLGRTEPSLPQRRARRPGRSIPANPRTGC